MKSFFTKKTAKNNKERLRTLEDNIETLKGNLVDLDETIKDTDKSIAAVQEILQSKRYHMVMNNKNLKAFEKQKADFLNERSKLTKSLESAQLEKAKIIAENMQTRFSPAQSNPVQAEQPSPIAPVVKAPPTKVVDSIQGNIQEEKGAEEQYNMLFRL